MHEATYVASMTLKFPRDRMGLTNFRLGRRCLDNCELGCYARTAMADRGERRGSLTGRTRTLSLKSSASNSFKPQREQDGRLGYRSGTKFFFGEG